MVSGLLSIAAAVVIRRRNPSCVNREKPIVPVSSSHQRRATGAWACSEAARASQTFMSGKLNELISLFVADAQPAPGWLDQGWIKPEPALGPGHLRFRNRALNAGQNQLPGRAAPAGRCLM